MEASFSFEKTPLQNFEILFAKAEKHPIKDANAMALATVSPNGEPSVRTVLFKGFVREGFSFFTNYNSQKAKELAENQRVGVLFFWSAFDQQVRIEGVVQKLSRQENENYFKTRPRASQVGAWASEQSEEIESFDFLQKKVEGLEVQYSGKEVPCPPHWGGYVIQPLQIEFWFGRVGRMHERFVYRRLSLEAPWERLLKSP